MKRSKISPSTISEFNSEEEFQPRNRFNYVATPIELIACPFFSRTEKDIITEIISLSNKTLTQGMKGVCWYSNNQLAMRHRVRSEVVSMAITKATRLGFVTEREDVVQKYNEKGKIHYSTQRKLCMRIPEEWYIMGDLYNEAFIQMSPEFVSIFEGIENKLKSIPTKDINQEDIITIIMDGTDQLISTPPKEKSLPPLKKNRPANKRVYNKSNNEYSKEYSSREAEKKIKKSSPAQIVKLWNDRAKQNNLPTVIKLTQDRRQRIYSRIKEKDGLPELSDWRRLFRKVITSTFLCGDNDRGWKVDLDWLIKNNSQYVKVLEGKYSNKKDRPRTRPGGAKVIPGKYDNLETTIVNGG